MKDQPAPKPSQRRLRFTRFGIRSLLVLTLIAAIAAYAWSRLVQRRKVMDLMFHHGIKIEYCQPEETALQISVAPMANRIQACGPHEEYQ